MKKQIMKVLISKLEELGYKGSELTDTTNLYNDIGIDSLDAIELVTHMEEEFDITVPDEKINEIRTVDDIVKAVEGCINNKKD